MAVSLRVPDAVKKRVDRLARAADSTTHAFMVEAIVEKVEAEEARAALIAEAQARLARMKQTGKGIPADEVFDYLARRAAGAAARRPRARKLP
jgi:predicted transcriptional regulator